MYARLSNICSFYLQLEKFMFRVIMSKFVYVKNALTQSSEKLNTIKQAILYISKFILKMGIKILF